MFNSSMRNALVCSRDFLVLFHSVSVISLWCEMFLVSFASPTTIVSKLNALNNLKYNVGGGHDKLAEVSLSSSIISRHRESRMSVSV